MNLSHAVAHRGLAGMTGGPGSLGMPAAPGSYHSPHTLPQRSPFAIQELLGLGQPQSAGDLQSAMHARASGISSAGGCAGMLPHSAVTVHPGMTGDSVITASSYLSRGLGGGAAAMAGAAAAAAVQQGAPGGLLAGDPTAAAPHHSFHAAWRTPNFMSPFASNPHHTPNMLNFSPAGPSPGQHSMAPHQTDSNTGEETLINLFYNGAQRVFSNLKSS